MPGYTTVYRYPIERPPKEEEAAANWVNYQYMLKMNINYCFRRGN